MLGHRHLVHRGLDDLDEIGKARGHAVGVARRETAADVDRIHDDASFHDVLFHFLERHRVGVGSRRLRADMKRDAEFVGDLARLDEQPLRLLAGDAELMFERHAAVLRGHRNAHEQFKILRAVGFLDDLLQLVLGVEREALDVVVEVRAANGVTRLHRMHEMQAHARNGRGILKLGDGGDIELRDAGAIERADQKDGAVRLVSVSDFARKIVDEPARGAASGVRTCREDRTFRLHFGHHLERGCEFLHRERTSCRRNHPCWSAAAERCPLSLRQ